MQPEVKTPSSGRLSARAGSDACSIFGRSSFPRAGPSPHSPSRWWSPSRNRVTRTRVATIPTSRRGSPTSDNSSTTTSRSIRRRNSSATMTRMPWSTSAPRGSTSIRSTAVDPTINRSSTSRTASTSSSGITRPTKTTKTLRVDLRFFNWHNRVFMPVEFSVGAYRFGHSMVRGEYELNDAVQDIPIFAKPPEPDLRGFRELPEGHVIQWARFFQFAGANLVTQPSRRIDTKLAFGLSLLPDSVAKGIAALAERDLKRGKALGLPSGQAVARAMGIPEDLILQPSAFCS